jgi:hypothetical protein
MMIGVRTERNDEQRPTINDQEEKSKEDWAETSCSNAMISSPPRRGRALLTGGLLVAFVGLSYASVIRRTSQNDLLAEFEREIAEENRQQALQKAKSPA